MMQDQFWDQRKNRTKMIYMTVIGVIFIPAYLFFALRQEYSLFLEVLSITRILLPVRSDKLLSGGPESH